jgi:putative hemolysin
MSIFFLQVAAIVLLILLNGFFAMTEMAVVSARTTRLKTSIERGNRGARAALRLHQHPDRFFSTVQVGITLVGILTGAVSGATIAEALEAWLETVPGVAPHAEVLALLLIVVPVTYLTLIFGELVPKRIAFGHPERVASFAAPSMFLLMRLAMPVVWILSASTRTVVRLLGLSHATEQAVTQEDIQAMIRVGATSGSVGDQEREMLERVFRLGDRRIEAIMTHRADLVWLDLDAPHEDNLRLIRESHFSRLPVAKGDIKEIRGVLKAREYLAACRHGHEPPIADYLHPPLIVPETTPALNLLELFKSKEGMQIAIVVDEYGDVQGIVTLYDYLESIVGDVRGPGEVPEPEAVMRDDGSWLLDGLMPMDEVADVLDRPEIVDEDAGYGRLAGFVMTHLGRVPQMGERFEWGGLRFEIMDMDGKRVDRVLVTGVEGPDPKEEQARDGTD